MRETKNCWNGDVVTNLLMKKYRGTKDDCEKKCSAIKGCMSFFFRPDFYKRGVTSVCYLLPVDTVSGLVCMDRRDEWTLYEMAVPIGECDYRSGVKVENERCLIESSESSESFQGFCAAGICQKDHIDRCAEVVCARFLSWGAM